MGQREKLTQESIQKWNFLSFSPLPLLRISQTKPTLECTQLRPKDQLLMDATGQSVWPSSNLFLMILKLFMLHKLKQLQTIKMTGMLTRSVSKKSKPNLISKWPNGMSGRTEGNTSVSDAMGDAVGVRESVAVAVEGISLGLDGHNKGSSEERLEH